MKPSERESLRLEAETLRSDILHLNSRIAFIEHWKDSSALRRELELIRRKIDALEVYAASIVKVHTDDEIIETLQDEIVRKNNRITQIAVRLQQERRELAAARSAGNASKRPQSERIGVLSKDKALELAMNLGMSVEDLKSLIGGVK